ncbi:zinc finger MYND domain-containing protein [Phanerochaete sordida]|uniref:Zinc finger MYND domain-containing protein n=1 Tax=Phanerochaete sordida TaxID=48140 RepID=A0A9P3GPN2_9APHY|nr:zinc finger MYND domain-containing protein [Phanerochaete sordida]
MAGGIRPYPSGVDGGFVVDLFKSSLADPHDPKHCATGLIGCLLVLFHPSVGMHNYGALRTEHPDFLDACMRFITVPRSDEENEQLEERMAVCSCDLSHKDMSKMHAMARDATTGCSYSRFGWMVANQIHNILQPVRDDDNLHEVEKNRQRAERLGTSVPWPRAPRDILPYGTEASIAALAVWIEFSIADGIWLGLFATIIELFKKEVVIPILSSPTLPGKFVGIAEIPFFMLQGDLPSNGGPDELARQIKRGAVLYKMLINFFDKDECRILFERANAQFAPDEPGRTWLSMCRDALAMLPAFAKAVPPHSAAALDIEHSIQDYTLAGVGLVTYLDLPADVATCGPTIAAAAAQHREMERKSPAYPAYVAFARLYGSARCWAPGCRATCAGEGRPFAACAGCARVTYCSKACQAAAWKHPDAPHRALCKKAKFIADAAGLGPKPEAEGMSAFLVTCVIRRVDRALLEEFSELFEKLQKAVSYAPFVANDASLPASSQMGLEQSTHTDGMGMDVMADSLGP